MISLVDVTVPRDGSTTARRIVSAALRHTLQRWLRLPTVGIDPALAAAYRELVAYLDALARADAGLLASIARRPSVSTLVALLHDPQRDDIDRDRCLAQLLAVSWGELAAADALPDEVTIPLPCPLTWTSWIRKARFTTPAGAHTLTVAREGPSADGTRLPAVDTDEHGPLFAPLLADAWLVRADDNPLALTEAHPDKTGNAVDLGGRPIAAWTSAIADALEPIASCFSPMHADIEVVLQQLVPVGYDPERHLSASYVESIGTVYASLHDDPMTMAEALIHEVSHNKLNALSHLGPLLVGGEEATHASPVRPDPRPLRGVLLAVHAFVAVAELYARMHAAGHPLAQTRRFARRREEVLESNRAGAAVLAEHAIATATGRPILDEIQRLVGRSKPGT